MIVIPSQVETVESHFTSANGREVMPFNLGHCGLEEIMISDVSGDLSMEVDEAKKERNYYFTRREVGKCVEVPAGPEIVTYGATHYLDYLPVIYIGTNGGYKDSQDLIEQQRAIINHYEGSNDYFIIIGIHIETAEERKELETAMEKEYGDNYINLREYMCTLAIDDANELLNADISITDHDKEMIDEEKTPASLMSRDELHFNSWL